MELSENAKERLRKSIEGKGFAILDEGDPSFFEKKKNVEILLYQKGGGSLDKETIQQLPALKFLQSESAGLDHIDFGILPPQVIVCGNVGAFSEPIAEHVMGMIIVLGKNLFVQQLNLRAGRYDHRKDAMFLKGKTVGIIGAGGIGQSVARLAKCFGMKTLGVNTSGHSVERFDGVATIDGLDDILPQCDAVVIALPLTIKTKGLIDAHRMKMMKEDSILINVSRGQIVVAKDLYEHLEAHPKFRAGSDVWWSRPNSNGSFSEAYPFFELPNFIGTPHVSGDVPEALEIASQFAVENVLRYVNSEPLKGVANREDYLGLWGSR
jgi:phosphoglycerate dehydrogenase-like enzyme